MDYVNDLLKNHPIESETEYSIDRHLERIIGDTETELDQEYLQQFGGNMKKPRGGFPPILVSKDIDKDSDILTSNKDKDKTKREFEAVKDSVKIKDIMEQRKEPKPFFKLD